MRFVYKGPVSCVSLHIDCPTSTENVNRGLSVRIVIAPVLTMGARPRVYITRQIPQKGLDTLLEKCNVCFWDSAHPVPRGELLTNVQGIDILLCMPNDRIDQEVLNIAGNKLKIVATMSEDSDHIDVIQCQKRGIRIINIPKVSMETLTDLTVALLAMATVKWMDGQDGNLNTILQQKDVKCIKNDRAYCVEISNRTLGIYGLSPLGLAVGKVLRGLGVSGIIYHDSAPIVRAAEIDAEYVTHGELLEKSDIICVCSQISSIGHTTPLFNSDAFKLMRRSAILIDATKGPVINFCDLYNALRSGEIAAAGLDVREYDVIPNRHPLASLENCHFLPFRECYKWDGRRKLSGVLAREILTALKEMGRVA